VKPSQLTYVRPDSVEEALEQLAAADGDAKLLAAGRACCRCSTCG
jgi:CO/xanthine dehydrogenase FAD-binding subunit